MDKEQKEFQSLGFFGIWRESFKIISTWNGIFLRLGLALILPLSFIYLAHIEINHLLSQNMSLNTLAITSGDTSLETTSRALLRQLSLLALIQVTYIISRFIYYVLPSAVIYTVACTYSGKKVTLIEVMYVIPKVWKRLMVTFLCVMVIKFVYNIVFGFIAVVILLAYPIDANDVIKTNIVGAALGILYLACVWYMDVIWQFANTISVLEENYGFQALRKSKDLMKSKMGISVCIYLVRYLCSSGVLRLFSNFVVIGQSNGGIFTRVGFGVISLLLLTIVVQLEIVVKTVFYLVCKSCQNEQIDEVALDDRLEVYHGKGYVLLKPKGVQPMDQV